MQDNPNYSYISTIQTPDGTTHYIKDSEARDAITQLGSPMHFRGSQANEAAIKALTSAQIGDIWLATDTHAEWVATSTITIATPSAWEKIGSIDGLGALAFKNNATGTVSITPSGTVSAPSITVTPSTTTIISMNSAGTLPTWGASVSAETLRFSWSAGTLPSQGESTSVVTGISSATATQPTFSGSVSSANVTVS